MKYLLVLSAWGLFLLGIFFSSCSKNVEGGGNFYGDVTVFQGCWQKIDEANFYVFSGNSFTSYSGYPEDSGEVLRGTFVYETYTKTVVITWEWGDSFTWVVEFRDNGNTMLIYANGRESILNKIETLPTSTLP